MGDTTGCCGVLGGSAPEPRSASAREYSMLAVGGITAGRTVLLSALWSRSATSTTASIVSLEWPGDSAVCPSADGSSTRRCGWPDSTPGSWDPPGMAPDKGC